MPIIALATTELPTVIENRRHGPVVVYNTLQQNGCESLGINCDVSNAQGVQQVVDAVVSRFGRLDVVVNKPSAGHS